MYFQKQFWVLDYENILLVGHFFHISTSGCLHSKVFHGRRWFELYKGFNLNWNKDAFYQVVTSQFQEEPFVVEQSYLRNDYDSQKSVYRENLADCLLSVEGQRLDGGVLQGK